MVSRVFHVHRRNLLPRPVFVTLSGTKTTRDAWAGVSDLSFVKTWKFRDKLMALPRQRGILPAKGKAPSLTRARDGGASAENESVQALQQLVAKGFEDVFARLDARDRQMADLKNAVEKMSQKLAPGRS